MYAKSTADFALLVCIEASATYAVENGHSSLGYTRSSQAWRPRPAHVPDTHHGASTMDLFADLIANTRTSSALMAHVQQQGP